MINDYALTGLIIAVSIGLLVSFASLVKVVWFEE